MSKKLMILLIHGFFVISIFSCKTVTDVGLQIENRDVLDSILDKYVTEGAYPFLYARLENIDGDVLYEHSAVNEDLLPDTKIDGNTWIRIWSMSKIVTIAVSLDLVEDGIIDLSEPVIKYIPEFGNLRVAVTEEGKSLSEIDWDNTDSACPFILVPMDSKMTIMHLINHESGFYYATTNIACIDSMLAEKNLAKAEDSQDLIDRLASLPLIQQPGSNHFYGTNTTVLGLVCERASGKSLQQLVKERITDPLKIEGLQYGLPENASLLPRFSGRDSVLRVAYPGELDIFGQDVPDYDLDHALYLGGEGMLATADGYTDFLRMLLKKGTLNDKRFLETATVEDIYAPHTQLDNPYGYNGYNLWISGDSMRIQENGDAGLWIGGGYEGTHFWVDPKREFVAVIMTQMFWIPPSGYGRDDEFRGALYKQFWKNELK